MIRHIVIFELKPEAATPAKLLEIKESLEALPNYIPELLGMEVGINVNTAEKQHFVLTADVKDLDDLEVYAKHPKHLEAGALIKPIATLRTCVDYEK